MAAELIIASAAEEDVDLAVRWYEEQRAGVGAQFLQQFRACTKRIANSPEMHAVIAGDYRRAMLRQFPYAVFYEFINDTVTIYAVLHTARDSTVWQSRIE
ncbi:MAG: type II toxin-antitoxin system RelE/ParE family toxin [Candidatus Saccharimonadales bacterium]